MKILSTAWRVFDENDGELEVLRNGGSIMICDICEYIGRLEESYLFVGSMKLSQSSFGHIHIVNNGKYLPQFRTEENIDEWHEGLNRQFEEALLKIKPDIVLVQGGGEFSSNCIEICKSLKQKFALVVHLFQGNRDIALDAETRKWEDRAFLDDNLDAIAVSTAMRKNILDTYPKIRPDRVTAIPNGTPFKKRDVASRDFRREFHLGDKKVLLCSGTLHPRKNQVQLVDAFDLLPEGIKRNTAILFCGNDSKRMPQKEVLEEKIKARGLEDALRYIGTFDRDTMHSLYAAVDGLVMPSLNEGLSLVALEALIYGKPVIMFGDNETAGDVNDPCATILVGDRSSAALGDGILKWYERDWDEGAIRKYADNFNMENVAEKYVEYCSQYE
ncbi:MAG: glycosyltransferase family 4 protein [Lachnospiraceae bacterium]|nr:glycosyltransferase family 4 protein [Lachnospiraceae bacterium]